MSRVSSRFRSPYFAKPSAKKLRFRRPCFAKPSPPLPKRKVVTIPFPSAAAVKIQRAFRGYMVRKNLRTVRSIESEVRGIELILGENKKDLKVNEMLMRLLCRLDSVRGVRDYRKKVIRRVIALQLSVDAMNAVKIQRAFRGYMVRKNLRTVRSIESEVDAIVRRTESEVLRDEKERLKVNGMLMRLLFRLDSVRGVKDYRKRVIRRVIALQESVDAAAVKIQRTFRGYVVRKNMRTLRSIESEVDATERRIKLPLRDEKERLKVNEMLMRLLIRLDSVSGVRDYRKKVIRRVIALQESVDAMQTPQIKETETVEEEKSMKMQLEKISTDMKEAMERMTADNEMLKVLVMELYERGAQQCRLMGGLVERVGALEKVAQKMERRNKNKRKNA